MFGIAELKEKVAKLNQNYYTCTYKHDKLVKDVEKIRADLDKLVGLMGYEFVDVEAHRELVKLPERSEE